MTAQFYSRKPLALIAIGTLAVLASVVVRAGGAVRPVDLHGARVAHIKIKSKAVGRQLPVSVVVPQGALDGSPRPLLVFLHGRGEDQNTFVDDDMFKALAKLRERAPIVAFPYGGDHSYWHDRVDGAWGRYVAGEVISIVARRFRADANRVAIGGVSMGGFGAYDLARLNRGRFCAVGGHSPALWKSSGLTAPGAFDDARDFARHDVIAAASRHPAAFKAQPVWLDAGRSDPFLAGDRAFVAALRHAHAPVTAKTWHGGHDQGYWNSHWNAYLRFYARALSQCGR